MKIFLTGVTGQVGFEIYRLLQTKHEVLAPTRQTLDLNDFDAVETYLDTHKPELIINPAAWTAVDKAEECQEENHKINAELPTLLAKYCQKTGIWLIHYSTDYVYPGTGEEPWTEESRVAPLNAYGKAKLAGEEAVKEKCDKHIILRTSWVYSYRGNNFLKTMLKLGRERDSLSIVADQIGSPTSALFISDLTTKIVERIMNYTIDAGVYNLCPNGVTSWCEFAKSIFELSEEAGENLAIAAVIPIPSDAYPTPAVRPLNSRMENNKLQMALDMEFEHWQLDLRKVVKRLFMDF